MKLNATSRLSPHSWHRSRAFSAGADLKEMGRSERAPKHGLAGLMEAIVEFPKPFLVAVNGVGAGIGATLCGVADVVFMAKEARLRCPFSALGLTAEAGSTYLLPRLMGRQRATWFLLAGEWMNGEECERAGLVMRALPSTELMPATMEAARKLAALPLASLVKTKQLIMDPLRPQLRASIAAEIDGFASLRAEVPTGRRWPRSGRSGNRTSRGTESRVVLGSASIDADLQCLARGEDLVERDDLLARVRQEQVVPGAFDRDETGVLRLGQLTRSIYDVDSELVRASG